MAHRDFSASLDEALKNRPTFTLNGVTFMCKPGVQWKTMAHVLETFNEDATSQAEVEQRMLGFFDVVLVKAARPKMHELLEADDLDEDDDVPVSMAQLTDIMKWLVEQYTGTPTQPSSDSSVSQNGTGEESKETTSSVEVVTSPN